jgi:hypothetical protein
MDNIKYNQSLNGGNANGNLIAIVIIEIILFIAAIK